MRRRTAFTITELLVVMALIVFIMYILAEAFSAGSTAFRNLRAIGDMNEKLRTASAVLRTNLQRDHFETKQRVSDPDFWKNGPPRAGFLRVYNGSPPSLVTDDPTRFYVKEGIDLDGNDSYRAVDHGLHFTVKARGNNRGDYFRASVPAGSSLLALPLRDTRFQEGTTNSVSSSWSEMIVFMRATNDKTDDVENLAAIPQPLYSLHLRQRALVPDNLLVQPRIAANQYTAPLPGYAEMSCHVDPLVPAPNQVLYFNGPADLTMPARRLSNQPGSPSTVSGPTATGPYSFPTKTLTYPNGCVTSAYVYPTLGDENAALGGDDVLLTNVLSFEVKVLLDPIQWYAWFAANPKVPVRLHDFAYLHDPVIQSFSMGNPSFTDPPPPANGPAVLMPRVFDTWSQAKDDALDYSTPNAADPQLRPLWQFPGQNTTIPLYQSGINNGSLIRIIALQITIRIWDSNTKQTRQTSVVVDI